MQDLKELTIILPRAIMSHFEARAGGLPDKVYDEALGLSHSIATAASRLTKLRFFSLSSSFYPRASEGFFVVLIERTPEVQVFEAELVLDRTNGQYKYVPIERP